MGDSGRRGIPRPRHYPHGRKETAIRILITTDSLRLPVRGVGRVCQTLLRELVRLGEQVIPLDWQDNPDARAITGRCEVLPNRAGPGRTARWHAGLLRRVARLGLAHDVLVNLTPFPHVLGAHPRLVLFVHDLHMLEPGFYQPGKSAWFRLMLGRSLRKAARLVCVSEFTRSELLRHFPDLDPARAITAHLWTDSTFDPDSAPAGDQGAASSPERRAYFLVVGQLESRKNLLRLLDAFAGARRQGVGADLCLAGQPGHGGAAILRRVAEPDLQGAVHLHEGPSDGELRRLYRDARALLFPSLCEGFGLPLLEAMQAGLPILTSATSSLPEVAGDAALLVDPTDSGAIERGIVRLDRDAGLRQELARRGRVRLRAFDPSVRVPAIVAVLRELCSTAPPTPAAGDRAPA